ncbi:MAG: C-type polyheme cytochrome OmcB [Deltaproteobacteria bacterium]|nr:C-type polyheme cytochrome OmcB [Deltaproteobacteria bacterium]
MSRIAKRVFTALALSLLATAMTGCGSGNKEGAPLVVTKVGDSKCIQCHSSVTEALTGESIVAQYQRSSPHNTPSLGCESCHGGGAMHNGVGPIPFPNPSPDRCASCHNGKRAVATNANTEFATSNHATGTPSHTGTDTCLRCHTHEGAVLGNMVGWTGTLDVITDAAIKGQITFPTAYTGISCETCHEHGGGLRTIKGYSAAIASGGILVNWDPNGNERRDQFDLCTSCHTLYNYNGTTLLVDGSTLTGGVVTGIVGQHETDWFRMLASTHYDNPNTGVGLATNVIEGYNLRRTGTNPCFDCHGHEAKTNTRNAGTDPTVSTIHTDWAQSAHAGHLLTAKYTAAINEPTDRTPAEVAAVMNAGVIDDATIGGPGWAHYNWDDTSTRGDCQACHTSTGISNYLTTQNATLTGYVPANNNFSHLSGWSATGGSPQNEMLYCWGCHSNAGTGSLRNTSQAILTFTFQDQPIIITDAGKSTACIVCHGGRGSAGEAAANDQRSSRFNGHHAPTAGVLYSAKTHIGYEYAGLSYANPSFFAHDKIGAKAKGPCASCHMGPAASNGKPSHTFAAVTESGGVITAINNQALCNTCHTPGGSFEVSPATLEEEKAGYAQASTILNNWVSNVAGYANYLGYAIDSTNYNNQIPTQPVSNNDYGAFQNAKLNGDEPCAYVHNRFYAKRLIFDSIDWMNNGVLDGTITIDATAFPEAALWFGAPVGTTGSFIASRP